MVQRWKISLILIVNIQKQASNDIMLKRKGKLGKTMNGLYIPIRFTEISDF